MAVSPEPVLSMRGIRKDFPGVTALAGVDFDLAAGEVHVLLGENGAGKSTLMRILSGAELPDSGTIALEGRSIEIRTPRQSREAGIAAIYQELNLVDQLSVPENIWLGNEPAGRGGWIDAALRRQRAQQLLAQLGASIDLDTPVSTLSIGEQHLVEIARALTVDARILILDEPTSALTDRDIEQLFATIRRLQRRGVAVVYISHRLAEIERIGNRITVLRDGRKVATIAAGEASPDELVEMMANRSLGEHFPKEPGNPGDTVLEAEDLRSRELSGVSLTLRAGEVVGVAGLVGSGRTALARALFGADRLESGRVAVRGDLLQAGSPGSAIDHGVGFLTEDRKSEGLVLSLSVRDNIGLPSLRRLSPGGWIRSRSLEKVTTDCIEQLRIRVSGPHQPVFELSGGNQQKVVLSKWLGCRSRILIFDEPTRGIDVPSKIELYRLLNRLTADGTAILMISSELPEVCSMSDRVLVMRSGSIVAELSGPSITPQGVLAAALGTGARPAAEKAE